MRVRVDHQIAGGSGAGPADVGADVDFRFRPRTLHHCVGVEHAAQPEVRGHRELG